MGSQEFIFTFCTPTIQQVNSLHKRKFLLIHWNGVIKKKRTLLFPTAARYHFGLRHISHCPYKGASSQGDNIKVGLRIALVIVCDLEQNNILVLRISLSYNVIALYLLHTWTIREATCFSWYLELRKELKSIVTN